MFKVYLSRRQTRAMSIDHPIGDPTGGPAYRELRDPVTAIAASAGANVLGSVIGGSASKSAASKQSSAALKAAATQQQTASEQIQNMQNLRSLMNIDLQGLLNDATLRGQGDRAAALTQLMQQRDAALSTISKDRGAALQTFQPYMQTGQQGLSAISKQLPYFQQQFGPKEFAANLDPSYEFMKQQGLGAIRQGMNVGGGGSNIDRAATKFAADYANTGYQNAFNRFASQQQNIYNRLAGIAGIGQAATGAAAQTGLGYDQLGSQTGLGYSQVGTQAGLSYDQLLNQAQLGFGGTMAQFNQGMGANIANLATGGAAAQAAGITGSAQASAAGDIGMSNAITGGIGNLGNLGMQYAMFQTPAIQQSLGLGKYATQTGGTGAAQLFNNPVTGLDASIDYS